jgi:NAD(P)H-dependent flavin oxidoreductase YrpB (nitropropane dioxygenase family)
VTDTLVTRAIDGHPQRVILTSLVRALEETSPITRLLSALRHAWAFRKLTGTSFSALLREGFAMRKRQELSWAQLLMAANAPMLTRASLVDGRLDSGVLPTGQVTGLIDELPSVAQLLERIVSQAEQTLARLQPPQERARSLNREKAVNEVA